MKRIYSIITLCTMALAATSCDFLNEDLKGSYSSENYYTTADKAEMAVNAVYNSLYGNTLWIFGDVASDDAVKGGNAGDQAEIDNIDKFNPTPDNGCLSTFWQNSYETISRANNVVTYVPNVNMDAATKERYIAEAKFFRAWAYFNLVNIFGQVPLKLKPQNTSDAIHVGLSSVEKIYNQIETDLGEAAPKLPTSYASEAGRVTQGAAYAMLAKVRLFRNNWVGALEAISSFDLIEDVYELEPNYADLFKADAENSTESVLSLRYINNNETSIGNNLNVWFSPSIEGGYYFDAPTQAYVDCFDELTAEGETDPRLDASIGRDGQPWFNGTTFSSSWSEATGYLVKKYNEDISEEFAKSQSTVPQHLIRYADVLLIKAEALNENNATADAAVELNKVRARAGLAATTAATQAEMREAIRKERRKELGFEFHRFFDVMRYGKEYAEKVLGSDFKWSEPRFYFPIPQAETDANAALNK